MTQESTLPNDFAALVRRRLSEVPISRNTNEAFDENLTFGQKLADQVAALGGSWGFITSFGIFLGSWIAVNTALGRGAADPYPYILLNLVLSMLAAIQAPIIMMSQNRQAAKDRLAATHDYEVNLKAELEIMALHEKLDQLRAKEMETLLASQRDQIDLLTRLLELRQSHTAYPAPSPGDPLSQVQPGMPVRPDAITTANTSEAASGAAGLDDATEC